MHLKAEHKRAALDVHANGTACGHQQHQHQQEGREGRELTNEAVTPQTDADGVGCKSYAIVESVGRQCMGSADCLHHPSHLSQHPASARLPLWLAGWLADKLYRPAYLQQHGIIQSVGVHSRWDMGV